MDSVPNPQSGRVAAAEDEVQGQSQSLHSYSGAVDPSLEAQFSQFSLDHPHVQMTQPGKLFVGGVSGTTTKVMFDEYFSQVRRIWAHAYVPLGANFIISPPLTPTFVWRTLPAVWLYDRLCRHV